MNKCVQTDRDFSTEYVSGVYEGDICCSVEHYLQSNKAFINLFSGNNSSVVLLYLLIHQRFICLEKKIRSYIPTLYNCMVQRCLLTIGLKGL